MCTHTHTQNAQYVLTQSTSEFMKMKEKFATHSLLSRYRHLKKERKKETWFVCANIYSKTDLFLHIANVIEWIRHFKVFLLCMCECMHAFVWYERTAISNRRSWILRGIICVVWREYELYSVHPAHKYSVSHAHIQSYSTCRANILMALFFFTFPRFYYLT